MTMTSKLQYPDETEEQTRDYLTAAVGGLLILAAVALLIGTGTMLATAPAAAQPDNPINDTDEDTGPDTELEDQLGLLDIHTSGFEDTDQGARLSVTVSWNGDTPQTMTISQFSTEKERAAVETFRLLPGDKTTVRMTTFGTAPALVFTDRSLERQQATAIRQGSGGTTTTTSLRAGVAIGTATALGGTGIMAYRKLNTQRDPSEGWD